IFRGIIRIAEESRLPVILPLHPRTSGVLTGHTGNDTYTSPSFAALAGIQDAGSDRKTVNGWTSRKTAEGKSLAEIRETFLNYEAFL
ncbi:MAG: hypothetical protein R6U11_12365, partial [Bacteroidales bacterium]